MFSIYSLSFTTVPALGAIETLGLPTAYRHSDIAQRIFDVLLADKRAGLSQREGVRQVIRAG
jgi:hypothetical protein